MRVPRAGEIVNTSETWDEPAGGGAVAAVQLAKLAGSCDLFTAIGDDEIGRTQRTRAHGARASTVHAATAATPGPGARVALIDHGNERTIVTLGDRLEPRGGRPAAVGPPRRRRRRLRHGRRPGGVRRGAERPSCMVVTSRRSRAARHRTSRPTSWWAARATRPRRSTSGALARPTTLFVRTAGLARRDVGARRRERPLEEPALRGRRPGHAGRHLRCGRLASRRPHLRAGDRAGDPADAVRLAASAAVRRVRDARTRPTRHAEISCTSRRERTSLRGAYSRRGHRRVPSRYPPFDELDDATASRGSRRLGRDRALPRRLGDPAAGRRHPRETLYVVRKGAVELIADGRLYDLLSRGRGVRAVLPARRREPHVDGPRPGGHALLPGAAETADPMLGP